MNKRIVVKVGTSSITYDNGKINLQSIEKLAKVLSDLNNRGNEVILVTSGAISVGASKLGFKERPKELRFKQAAASVGQSTLMHIYDKFFSEFDNKVAQILLTGDDVLEKDKAEHLSNTFDALLELGVVPIVNENDSISSAEIETGSHKVLGDNDTLSAIVAKLVRADLLVLLSDIDGLFEKDPKIDPNAKLIECIDVVTSEIEAAVSGAGSWRGTGGMITKLSAGKIALESNFDMIITNANKVSDLYDLDNIKGTLFKGKK